VIASRAVREKIGIGRSKLDASIQRADISVVEVDAMRLVRAAPLEVLIASHRIDYCSASIDFLAESGENPACSSPLSP
jgi:hypothetical protein